MYSDLVLTNWSDSLNNIQFYCVVCRVSLASKSDWELHVNGHHRSISTSTIPTTPYCGANLIEKVIDKTIRLLGSQTKFVVRVSEENTFKFQCLLCLVELNSYFAVSEHLDDRNHQSHVERTNFGDNSSIMPGEDGKISFADFSKAVKPFCTLYSGSLKCNRCLQTVNFDEKTIVEHERQHHSSSPASIIEKFRVFLESEQNTADEACPKPSLDMLKTRMESLQFDSAGHYVSRFQCVNCDVSGPTDEWRPHLLGHHIEYWDRKLSDMLESDWQDVNGDIFCVCLLCDYFFYGQRKTIAQHPHFADDSMPNDFPSLKTTPFTEFLCKIHCRQRAQRDGTHAAYVAYCDACESSSFENLEEHFASSEHKRNVKAPFDWYVCRTCLIVFYGERCVYDIHKLLPVHLCDVYENETGEGETTARRLHHDNHEMVWTETDEHVTLMNRLREKMKAEPKNWYRSLSSCEQLTYFCGVCDAIVDSYPNWRDHLCDEVHMANAIRGAAPFEGLCHSCNLIIFGRIECHVGHSQTEAHHAIKRSILVFCNEERVKNRTVLMEDVRVDEKLSDRLCKTLKLSGRSTSPSCNAGTRESCAPPSSSDTSKVAKKDKSKPTAEKAQSVIEKSASTLSAVPKMKTQIEEQFSDGVYKCKVDIRDERSTRETIDAFLLKSENRCQSQRLNHFHCSFCDKYYGRIESWRKHLVESNHALLVKIYFEENATAKARIFHCTVCETITFGTTTCFHDYRKCSKDKRRSVSRTSRDRGSTRSASLSSNDVETESTGKTKPIDVLQPTAVERAIGPSSATVFSSVIDVNDRKVKWTNRIAVFISESKKRRTKIEFTLMKCWFCDVSHVSAGYLRTHLACPKHVGRVRECLRENPNTLTAMFHCVVCNALSFGRDLNECHDSTCAYLRRLPGNTVTTTKVNGDDCATTIRMNGDGGSTSTSVSLSRSSSNGSKTDLTDETEESHRIGSDCGMLEPMNDDEGEEDDLEETMKNEEMSEDVSSIYDESEDDRNKVEEEPVNGDARSRYVVQQLIIVRGIPADNLKNKSLIQRTFRKYGNLNRTYVKKHLSDTLFIVVNGESKEMLRNLKDNIDKLKMELNAEELTIGNKVKSSSDGPGTRDYLSEKAEMLFANQSELNNAISFLMKKYNEEMNNPRSIERIGKLVAEVQDLAVDMYDSQIFIKAYVFGSRSTGLASENSDVDIYLQIANSFRGATADSSRLQRELVLYFASRMRMQPDTFTNVTSISLARVPIVRFTHVLSNLNCDLSFKSGLSTMNSILVRIYLELDERVKCLVCGVKLWMKLNEIASSSLFTTYAQIWIVLFFLMQPEFCVVPTVVALRRMLPPNRQEFLIEGWNCAFPKLRNIAWKSRCTMSTDELLYKFFEFYSNENLDKYVLCTMTGMKMEKKHFVQSYENLPKMWFAQFTACMKFDRVARHRIMNDFEGLCVQDPFDHAHNVTKTINGLKYKCFVEKCRKTTAILKKPSACA